MTRSSRRASIFGSVSDRMVLSDLELYQSYAEGTSLDDQIRSYNREIKRLRRSIRRQHSDLRRYILESGVLGPDADVDSHPALSSISLYDTVSNDGPISLVDDATDRSQFERNSIEPTFDGLNTIYKEMTSEQATLLETKIYDLKKFYLRVRELEFFMGKLYNLKASSTDSDVPTEEEIDEGDKVKRDLQLCKDYNKTLCSFNLLFKEITSIQTTTEEEERYRSYMQYNSVNFVHYKKKLIRTFEGLPTVVNSQQEALAFFAHISYVLPKQFTAFVDTGAGITAVRVKNMQRILQKAIHDLRVSVGEKEGPKNNEYLNTMAARVRSLLKSPSFIRHVTDLDRAKIIEVLKNEKETIDTNFRTIDDKLKELNTKKNSLEALLSGTEPIGDSKVRRFFRNLAYRTGGVINTDPDTEKALEELLRDQVRREYGGNLPFEDEEQVKDKNNKQRFVKRKDLIRVRGSKGYRIRAEVEAESAARRESDGSDIN